MLLVSAVQMARASLSRLIQSVAVCGSVGGGGDAVDDGLYFFPLCAVETLAEVIPSNSSFLAH